MKPRFSLQPFALSLCLAALAASAPAQSLINDVYTLTNIPSIMETGGASNITTTPIRIRQNYGVSFSTAFAVSNSGTGNLTFFFDLSPDGTNYYTTTHPLRFDVAGTGTTGVRHGTNFNATLVNNFATIKLTVISNNAGNCVYLTNVVAGRGR